MARGSILNDGGRQPSYFWVIASLGLLLSLAQAPALNSVLSVFVKPMGEELGWTRGTISGVATLGAIASGLLGLVAGPLMDRRGMRLLTVFGVLVLGVSLAGLSQVNEVWSFYALHSLARVGAIGIVGVAVTVAVSNWFIKSRGRVMGLAFLGNRLGGAVFPIVALYLIVYQGWRFAWLTLGALVALLAVPSFLYLRRRPEDIGLLPDGLATREGVGQPSGGQGGGEKGAEPNWTLRSAVKTPTLWLLALASSQAYLVMGSLNLHQVPYMTDVGIPATLAVGALTVTALSSGGGGFLWGMLAERIHVRYALAGAFVLEAFSMILLILVRTPTYAYGYAVLGGMAIGGTISLSGIVWAEYFGRNSVGAIQGLILPMQMFANASGPFVSGWAYDLTGEYTRVFTAFAVACILAALFALLARPRKIPTGVVQAMT